MKTQWMKLIAEGCNIKYKICMDNIEKDGVLKYTKMLEDGENIIKSEKLNMMM